MSARPEVIGELRSMFIEGATPSRLIRHIAERHEGETRLHFLIQDYFLEAFGVPIVRGLNPIDDYRHDDLRLWYLNEQLIPQMIQHRADWLTTEETIGTWLEGMVAHDERDNIEAIRRSPVAEMRDVWDKLSAKEQYFIQMSMGSANSLYETVKILSRLTECLQQKIVELQASQMPALSEIG